MSLIRTAVDHDFPDGYLAGIQETHDTFKNDPVKKQELHKMAEMYLCDKSRDYYLGLIAGLNFGVEALIALDDSGEKLSPLANKYLAKQYTLAQLVTANLANKSVEKKED